MDKRALIFDLQRFCLEDGPGIRTTVFFKGCPLMCKWCSNPESQKPYQEIMYSETKCIKCGNCISMCPQKAIMQGVNGIIIDRDLCTMCGECSKHCCTKALEKVGQYYTVSQLIKEIMRDKIYFDASGGGVTISGGDPLMQSEFATELLIKLKENNIHTTIETSGYGKWENIKKVFKYCDLIYYDIKHYDNDFHMQGTGCSNLSIFENIETILKIGYNTIIRIPIIPLYNNDYNYIYQIVKYIQSIGGKNIELLPYHDLGVNKYSSIGQEYTLDISRPADEEILTFKNNLKKDFNLNIL